MNDKIKAANNFKIGADFELHTLKKKDLEARRQEKLKSLGDDGDEGFESKRVRAQDKRELNLSAIRFTNVGFYLVTPLLAGVILGSFIDGKLNTRPVATICFIAAGTVAMFYNLFRLTKKN